MEPWQLDLPPPKNWQDLEELCHAIWELEWRCPSIQKHGRSGQPQKGVDIFGRPAGVDRYHGIQCKLKSAEGRVTPNLTRSEIEKEVASALSFEPPLAQLIIATTAPSDATMQGFARELSQQHSASGLFGIDLLAWPEIRSRLAKHPAALARFYPSLGRQTSILASARSRIRGVPPVNRNFAGRDEILTLISNSFSIARAASVPGIVAATGLGGVGKSSIAAEYCWRHHQEYFAVWWVNGSTRPGVLAGLADHAVAVQPDILRKVGLEGTAGATLDLISGQTGRWLLVYDAVTDPGHLSGLLPTSNADIIITSQFRDWQNIAVEVYTDTFDTATATDFLLARSGRQNRSGAQELVEALGGLPLAIEHAGAFLRRTPGLTYEYYRESIKTRLDQAPNGSNDQRSVFATFSITIERILRECPQAKAMISFLSVMAPEAIDVGLINSSSALSEVAERSLRILFEYSLLSYAAETQLSAEAIVVHRLVQRAMRIRSTPIDLDRSISQAATILGEYSSAVSSPRIEEWRSYYVLSMHGEALLEAARELSDQTGGFWASLKFSFGNDNLDRQTPLRLSLVFLSIAQFYRHRRDTRRAIQAARLSLRLAQTLLGSGFWIGSAARNVLNIVKSELCINLMNGSHDEAAPLIKKLLRYWSKQKRHWANPLIATVFLDITKANNDPAVAEALAKFCYDAGVKCFTANPQEIRMVEYWFQALARCQQTMGDLDAAEEGLKFMLSIFEESGVRDERRLGSFSRDLGSVLLDADRDSEAESHLRVALRVEANLLGDEHPAVALDRYFLAVALGDEADCQTEAISLLERARDSLVANNLVGDEFVGPTDVGAIAAVLMIRYINAGRTKDAISAGENAIKITSRTDVGEGLTKSLATLLVRLYDETGETEAVARIRSTYELRSFDESKT